MTLRAVLNMWESHDDVPLVSGSLRCIVHYFADKPMSASGSFVYGS